PRHVERRRVSNVSPYPARAFRPADRSGPDHPYKGASSMKQIIAAFAAVVMTATWAGAQEVKVGVALPYTGIGAEFAQLIDRGMELYLKLNADQVKPYKIVLI